ncbi:MAG TPA: dehydrogenase, partial [Nitrosopumilus sp.]|nr:dehydrogenase [Nitrosopumilus sp.]
ILLQGDMSFHILNYNSPGATGALPFSAHVVNQLHKAGLFENESMEAQCGPWKFNEIIENLNK